MSYSELDKVSWQNLNPDLKEIINNKVELENYRSFANEFNQHKTNMTNHMSSSDRAHYDYAYKRVVELLDGTIGDTIKDMSIIVDKVDTHISDTEAHWTPTQRNEYQNKMKDIEDHFDSIENDILGLRQELNGYTDQETYANLLLGFNNHVIDKYVHVSPAERAAWNGIFDKSKSYIDGVIAEHTLDEDIHVLLSDKNKWNSHVDEYKIHMTVEEKGIIANHVANENIHVTNADKIKWNNHMTDSSHITTNERVSINNHFSNSGIHVTQTQKTNWTSHMSDANVHVSQEERYKWNQMTTQIQNMQGQLDYIYGQLQAMGKV